MTAMNQMQQSKTTANRKQKKNKAILIMAFLFLNSYFSSIIIIINTRTKISQQLGHLIEKFANINYYQDIKLYNPCRLFFFWLFQN